jgi:tRNA pseudouridine55 synthase
MREQGHQRVKVPRIQIDGVLLLDKPLGLSSNDALMRVKRITRALKAGHGGTLDPLATGLLPIAFGEATKFLQSMLDARKTYLADIDFGQTTTTGDREGQILETTAVTHTEAELNQCLSGFLGEITQVPPMYSALKKEGVPLYELARAGIEVERQPRQITVFSLELVSSTKTTAVIRVTCSKGTYIRTLAEDIGKQLQCGAHLSALRREAVEGFTLAKAVTIEALEQITEKARLGEVLLDIDAMIQNLPRRELDETLAQRFMLGQRIKIDVSTSLEQEARLRVYSQNRLLGLASLQHGVLSPIRLVQHSVDKISSISPVTPPAAQEALVNH